MPISRGRGRFVILRDQDNRECGSLVIETVKLAIHPDWRAKILCIRHITNSYVDGKSETLINIEGDELPEVEDCIDDTCKHLMPRQSKAK